MSLNIPEYIVRVSDPIKVNVRISKLGPRQKSSLMRGLAHGIVTEGGVASELAMALRRKYELPILHIRKRDGHGSWEHGNDKLFTWLNTLYMADRMVNSNFYQQTESIGPNSVRYSREYYALQALDHFKTSLTSKSERGSFSYFHKDTMDIIDKKKMSLGSNEKILKIVSAIKDGRDVTVEIEPTYRSFNLNTLTVE